VSAPTESGGTGGSDVVKADGSGATGFDSHIAPTAIGSGVLTIPAGCDRAKLDALAAELGAERRAFGLGDRAAIELNRRSCSR
jgi:hypothetical protein